MKTTTPVQLLLQLTRTLVVEITYCAFMYKFFKYLYLTLVLISLETITSEKQILYWQNVWDDLYINGYKCSSSRLQKFAFQPEKAHQHM